ncbi:hypothetical protein B1757_05745 [Acidithiobacillus marinus]|uniref:STAS domain-containing protein n=1 Tax=Acidithiobacillus marinus TaxID=187490 RepID=A0A2I1DMU1_9PROT|nr:STAS domain-containing protein [Acidithiobacillus marinus]PKY11184.1 hypothetical protein B1757_05745 [Acidithiobacillus marinus]
MSLDIQQENSSGKLQMRLLGDLDIYAVGALRETLQIALTQYHELELILEDVCEIDGAGLQVLVAAKNEALCRGSRLFLRDHSVAVIQALQLCRLDSFFGDPVVLTKEMPG